MNRFLGAHPGLSVPSVSREQVRKSMSLGLLIAGAL